MNSNLARIEPAAKVLAATGLAQSLSFCMERKYLDGISGPHTQGFHLSAISSTLKDEATWIAINQVGKPVDDASESCFTAIQKILYASFLPREAQLLFLITWDGTENKMFLGVRGLSDDVKSKRLAESLNEFMKGAWPGLQTTVIPESESPALDRLKADIKGEEYEYIYSITGVPSMESQYKTIYPATMDKLMAGMNKSKKYAYLVVADPVEIADTEQMLYQCRDMNGRAESLKTINVSEGLSKGLTDTISHTLSKSHSDSHSDSHSVSHSESTSKKDFGKLGKAALYGSAGGVAGLAIGAAASIFPAANAIAEGAGAALNVVASAALGMVGLGSVSNMISGLVPQKTTTDTMTDTTTDTYTDTTTHSDTTSQSQSETNTKSLSSNIVNKHIEAVSEKLFFHTNRLEAGKAIGLWKVGVYLMGCKRTDIQSGSIQLKSLLSGQESVYEPIRIHNISEVLDTEDRGRDGTFREYSLAKLTAPNIAIQLGQSVFKHPLGDSYTELKTVLNTKELSYLINFPLHTVPGISVIESSPEFSLNRDQTTEDGISFGKLLYGGSETKIDYTIPKKILSRHSLVCGINGSGKTNTVQSILNGIGDLPFLVIEPAKTEYVDWALEYNKAHPQSPIDIFIPGCKKYKTGFVPKELKLNPFEIVWLDEKQEPNVLTHIDRLKSVFAAAFPMYDILPILMEDLIYTVYQNKSTDWLNVEPVFGKTMFPTLNSMSTSVEKVIEHRQYEDKVQRNMKACLNTRIDSLKRGWKGQMLNTLKSTPWDELFEKPCIINLSYVGDDMDKAFFMALVLQFLYEYRSSLAEIGRIDFNSSQCHHLTIIEEAHRVMSKCENQELPQYKSAMMFSNMLSEIRAYGEGLLLVDQVPTRLIPDAIKNTNLKIVHRLVAEDDSKAIGESMGLSDEQRKVISKLMTGQCIVSSSLTTDTYWVKANKVK